MKRFTPAIFLFAAACRPSAPETATSQGAALDTPVIAGYPLVSFGGPKNAAIWIATTSAATNAELVLKAEGEDALKWMTFDPPATNQRSQTLRLTHLQPDTTYDYVVIVRGETSTSAAGSFHTSPRKGEPIRATFAVVSCMNVTLYPNQVAWNTLAAERPDLLIQLGDNVYSGGGRPDRARGYHFRQRSVPEYRKVLERTSVIAVWDDHDYIGNDADGTAEEKAASLALFREVFPNPSSGTRDEDGIFFSIDYGDVEIFMLDIRYHRSSRNLPPEQRSILGDIQLAWLESKLKSSHATFKLIATGSTLSRGDSWSDYPRDLQHVFALTREVPGIVFLTGDLHESSLFDWPVAKGFGKLAYPLLEITSSGIAVRTPLFSFATLDINTKLPDPELTAVIHRVDESGAKRGEDRKTIKASQLQCP